MDLNQRLQSDKIFAQLERILASAPFANSRRSQRFLRYVVENSVKGEEEPLKEYTIAIEVFDRSPSYDPSTDAAVRVEAGRLRSRLRDYYRQSDPDDCVLIEIPKGGYRCTFTALKVQDHEPVEINRAQASVAYPRVWRMITRCVITIVLVGVGAFTWRAVRNHGKPIRFPKLRVRVVQLTNLDGDVSWPAFSPDGKQIAYIWDAGVHPSRGDLYVQFVAGGTTPLRLTHTRSEYLTPPTWLPNGREISFGRCDDNGGAIFVISALGGPERRITDAPCPFGYIPPVSWTKDGRSLIVAGRCVPDGSIGIVVFSMEDGQKRCLVRLQKTWGLSDAGPVISPDDKTIAFVSSQQSGVADLYTVPLAGGIPTPLTTDGKATDENFTPMWTADGKFICFNSTRSGPERTWRVRATGGPVQAETIYPGVGALSPDGGRLVYQGPSAFDGSSVWRASLAAEGANVIDKKQLLNDSANDFSPRPSPDGREVVFESVRSGNDQIWKSNDDGSNARRLTSFTGNAGSPRWSADGKSIAFDYLADGTNYYQVYTMDSEGRNQRVLISGPFNNSVPSWSQDGKTIYFCSDRSGSFQIWRHEIGSGRETQLTHDGGLASMESFDGKTVYFSKLSGGGIWSIPASGGEVQHITTALHFGYWGEFAVTENGIYLVDSSTDPGPSLMYYSFRTRNLKRVVNLNDPPRKTVPWSANLGASRDGRTVLFVLGTFRSSLVMSENLQ